ncbi:MAG: hypothetical protein QXS37_03050 [Candidatus Aenigmatarchaeota archaeon]
MEKPIYIILLIILALVLIVAVVILLPIIKGGVNDSNIELNQACLELIKKGCDETQVFLDSKSFEEICEQNKIGLEDCKKYCGC